MDRIDAMAIVVAIAEAGSLSGQHPALCGCRGVDSQSQALYDLEARIKTTLFQRSSRNMTLTDARHAYLAACKRIIEQVEDAEREASGEYRTPTGDLSVTSPWGIGHLHLLPLSCEFLGAYPDISLRLVLTDRVLNIVENNIDVSVRLRADANSSLIAARTGSVRVVTCASPSYLSARGIPLTPSDLRDHDCICVDDAGPPAYWRFGANENEVIGCRSLTSDSQHVRSGG